MKWKQYVIFHEIDIERDNESFLSCTSKKKK